MGESTVSRGQSEVLGTALLFGFVIIAAVAVAAAGAAAFGGTQEQAERDHLEQTLLDIRSTSTDVALGAQSPRTMRFDLPDDARLSVNESAGSITVKHLNHTGDGESDPEELYPKTPLGALEIEYRNLRYGFQGGGIFLIEDDFGSMVVPPTIGHRGLTLQISSLIIVGDGAGSGSASIDIRPGPRQLPAFPDLDAYYEGSDKPYDNPVANGTVRIIIESPYYEGWYQFFDQRTEGAATIHHDNETVIVDLEALQEVTFDAAVKTQQNAETGGASEIDGDVEEYVSLVDSRPLIDYEIEEAIDENENDATDCIENNTLTAPACDNITASGTYYLDDDTTLDDDLRFDPDGDITLVIDGDFDLENHDIIVYGDEYSVTYYIKGNLDAEGNAEVGTHNEAIEANRNVFVVGGEFLPSAGTPTFDAVIYAPNSDVDVTGDLEINGALLANSIELGGNAYIEYDFDALDEFAIDLSGVPTPITYLHVDEHTAVVDIG